MVGSVIQRLLDAHSAAQITRLVTCSPIVWIQGLQLRTHRLRDLLGTAMTDDTLRRFAC